MICQKCGYHRFIAQYCARCGTAAYVSGSFEAYLVDFLRVFKIRNTHIYVFPTILGNDKSFGYWTNDLTESFFTSDADVRSRVGWSVDVIVNSANNQLIPGSGLANYLRKKLSTEYEQACLEMVKTNTLQKGKAYFIGIPSQYKIKAGVIESIAVEYQQTSNGWQRVLSNSRDVYNCVFSCLKLCDEMKLTSIALPQMLSREGYSIYTSKPSKRMIASSYLAINDYLISCDSKIEVIFFHPTDLESEELISLLFDDELAFSKSNTH